MDSSQHRLRKATRLFCRIRPKSRKNQEFIFSVAFLFIHLYNKQIFSSVSVIFKENHPSMQIAIFKPIKSRIFMYRIHDFHFAIIFQFKSHHSSRLTWQFLSTSFMNPVSISSPGPIQYLQAAQIRKSLFYQSNIVKISILKHKSWSSGRK